MTVTFSTLTFHFKLIHGAGLLADVIVGGALILSIVSVCNGLNRHGNIALREGHIAVPAQVHSILHPVDGGGLTVGTAGQAE